MSRRLILSYLGLAVLILVVLEVPLAILAARHERDLTAGQAERVAAGLAAVASEDTEHGHISDLAALVSRYQAQTGGEVAVVDPAGRVLAASGGDANVDAAGEQRSLVQAALSGAPASSFGSDEGAPWAAAAVPISSGGKPQGAVLLGYPAASTETRIHDVWIALGALAAAVLVVTAAVGALLARSLSLPLARLESAVGQLADGDLSVQARDDEGPPQIRSLAARFNLMARRLADLVDAQSRFVADASHQLRSPLTALRLRLENLEVGADARSAEGLVAAGSELQRLSRIVDGLLTLSVARSDQPERRPVDLAGVIAQRCDAWAALAEERQVELVPDVDGSRRPVAPLVPGDLDQIVDNLLANAVDASPEGGTIRVTLAAEPGWWELHVADEGPGMAEEDRHRAFDRFWQGSGTNGHSGLGLAIVHQLAARNDADVELRQADPTGLDAVVRLPRTRTGEKR